MRSGCRGSVILSGSHCAARSFPLTLPALTASLLRRVNTLKFKVVAITVATSVLAALASTEFALSNTQADLERLLLENARDDSKRMAAMLGSKLETLEVALSAADEPGLARPFARWQAAGRRIETRSIATLSDDHVVALTGIPKSDWLLVRPGGMPGERTPASRCWPRWRPAGSAGT